MTGLVLIIYDENKNTLVIKTMSKVYILKEAILFVRYFSFISEEFLCQKQKKNKKGF